MPSLQCFGFCFGYCVGFLLLGYAVFRKLKRNFILYI